MKTIGGVLFLSACALMIGCAAPAANTPTNSNANSNANSKPTASAPTADTLLAMDKQANEAWTKGDSAFFSTFLSDKAVGFMKGKAMGKDGIVKEIASVKCDIKTWSLEDPKAVMIDNDNYVVVYKGNFDGQCAENGGKMEKVPTPVRAATLYTRNADKWQAVWHSETPIMDAAAAPKPDDKKAAAPADEKKADDSKAEAKKEEPKKDDTKANANTANANTAAAPAAPAKSANTDALVKAMQAGWDGWKAKDAAAFNMVTTGLTAVDPAGAVTSGKDETVKHWTTMNCEGVTKVAVSDGYSVALSPTIELLNNKGNADGKCDGHANGDLWQTSVWVKEGDAWKMAFLFENMPMPGM